MKKNVFLIPRLENAGGVANYYSVMKSKFKKDFHFLYRGKENGRNDLIRLISDFLKFYKKVNSSKEFSCVTVNSSLGKGGFIRDGLYLLLTEKPKKKIVFFRGWNPLFERKIDESYVKKFWLKQTFLNANHIIVLSSKSKEKLIEWGYKGPISIETTIVDENLIGDWNFKILMHRRTELKNFILFYIGSIHKEKGVREITESLAILHERNKTGPIQMNMAGAGTDENLLRKKAKKENLPLHFLGYVRGNDKVNAFINAHLFVFASYHEGMPNAVLEAIAFGLPVLTTRVGGIPDFFEDGKMGLFLDNREPEHIAEKIEYLLDRPEMIKEMSEYNYNYAKEHFYASKVAARLEKIIYDVVEGRV